MNNAGDNAPFRAKCPQYAMCFDGPVMQHGRLNWKRQVYKNTTAITGAPVDGTTGKSIIAPLGGLIESDCSTAVTGIPYNGINYASSPQGGWGTDNYYAPVNTYLPCYAVLSATVASGGSGYVAGDVGKILTVAGGSTETINGQGGAATLVIKSVAGGQVTGVAAVNSGIYSANPVTTNTAAGSTTGSGATFNLIFTYAYYDFGSACYQGGYASAASARSFHGKNGYVNSEGCVNTVCSSGKTYEGYESAPPTQKYLNKALDFTSSSVWTITNSWNDASSNPQTTLVVISISYNVSTSSAINVNSGCNTVSGVPEISITISMTSSSSSGSYYNGTSYLPAVNNTWTGIGNAAVAAALADAETALEGQQNFGQIPVNFEKLNGLFVNCLSVDMCGGVWVGVTDSSQLGYEVTINTDADFVANLNSSGAVLGTCTNGTATHSDTELSFGCGNTIPGEPTVVRSFSCTITLSNPNTAASVLADCESNYAAWVLTDRILMPLTSSAYNGVMPLVTRNELAGASPSFQYGTQDDLRSPINDSNGNAPFSTASTPGQLPSGDPVNWIPTYTPMAWVDPDCYIFTFPAEAINLPTLITSPSVSGGGGGASYGVAATALVLIVDGSVQGLPGAALAGAGGPGYPEDYFYAGFLNYKLCSGSGDTWYVDNYGCWRSSYPTLPPRATQWTNQRDGLFLPVGRSRKFQNANNLIGEGVADPWSGKLVSVKWVESSVRLPSFDHSQPHGGSQQTELDQNCLTCDGDTPVCPGTSLPSPCRPDCIRFPVCPPFAGRLKVVSVTDNGDGTCTLVTEDAGTNVDSKDANGNLYNVTICGFGMVELGSYAPTASSSTTFKVTAAYSDISKATYVVEQGALPSQTAVPGVAHWYWYDTRGKGNFVLIEAAIDYRTNGESSRLAGETECDDSTPVPTGGTNYGWKNCSINDECKGFISCAPWLIVLSPNSGDEPSPGTGALFDFSHGFTIDERYGAVANLLVSQAMGDPLLQAVQSDCLTPPSCKPLLEARAVLPGASGSPPDNGAGASQTEAPPSWCVNYALLTPCAYNSGNVVLPPYLATDEQPVQCTVTDGIWGGC